MNKALRVYTVEHQFIDALRECRGLAPLYREPRTLCTFSKLLQSTTDSGGAHWWTHTTIAPRKFAR